MKAYEVRQGQNIYDVALTLYGSIEGIFDLFICNTSLSFDTALSKGDILYYHDAFVINSDICSWLASNIAKVANGNHYITIDA